MDASQTCDQVLQFLKSSNLNYFLSESAFSVSIEIKKTFITNKDGSLCIPKFEHLESLFSPWKCELCGNTIPWGQTLEQALHMEKHKQELKVRSNIDILDWLMYLIFTWGILLENWGCLPFSKISKSSFDKQIRPYFIFKTIVVPFHFQKIEIVFHFQKICWSFFIFHLHSWVEIRLRTNDQTPSLTVSNQMQWSPVWCGGFCLSTIIPI